MVVNDNAGWQVPRGAFRFIASKLGSKDRSLRQLLHRSL